MKPTNLNKETCNPISSNCVIWQGPDIPCIQLCKGDSVSDVVAKLAAELCVVLDMLNVENYDLTCFNITACGPSDFQLLIQFIIDKICELENIPAPDPGKSGCPDCLVTVNKCKDKDGNYIFLKELGETTQLVDYVQAIAGKICTLVFQVGVIESTLVNLEDRIEILEGYFPLPVPPETEIIPERCLGLPTVPTPVSTVLNTLQGQFCDLIEATGSVSDIVAAYVSQCTASTDDALAVQYSAPGTSMLAEYPTWVVTPGSLADTITNIWLALCDVRNAGHQLTAVAAGTNTTVTSAVSVVAGDQVTTYTVNSDANPLQVLNESVSLTSNASSMNFVGDLVTATNSGTDVTVTVNTFGGMLAQDTPSNLNAVAFGLGNVLCFQPVQVISEIYDDSNAYNPLTGIWTCPATGRYNLSCYAHYTRDAGTGWYDAGNPGGMFGIGIFQSTGCAFYCANWMTVMGVQKHIDITAQAIGMPIVAGTQLSVKVLNQTGNNYASVTGDAIRFSIERIK